jgi:uncharacterized protein YndB with AHSA1/START domain
MPVEHKVVLKITRKFTASAERVYDAFLDPKIARQFLFASNHDSLIKVKIDARVGGRFTFTDRRNGEDVVHTGEYLELVRPTRIVFTFAIPTWSDRVMKVSIDIVPLKTGCELTLVHEGVVPEFKERTKEGWENMLAGCAKVIGE